MATQTLTNSWADVDSVTDDVQALTSSGGLGKDLILQNDVNLKGKQAGGAQRRLISMDTSDRIHIGQGDPVALHSGEVLISAAGVATGAADVNADDFVIDGLLNRGMTITAGNAQSAFIDLGDPDDTSSARIEYRNSSDSFFIRSLGDIIAFRIESDAGVVVPNGDFEVASGFLAIGTIEDLTLSSGVVTATTSNIRVDTEGAAPAGDLDTISSSAPDGTIIVVRSRDSARDVTLKDGTGNLNLDADIVLTGAAARATLQLSFGTWYQLPRV